MSAEALAALIAIIPTLVVMIRTVRASRGEGYRRDTVFLATVVFGSLAWAACFIVAFLVIEVVT